MTTTDWTVLETEMVVAITLDGVTVEGGATHFVQTVWVLVTKRVDRVGMTSIEV